jgi:hypothetical protein
MKVMFIITHYKGAVFSNGMVPTSSFIKIRQSIQILLQETSICIKHGQSRKKFKNSKRRMPNNG